MTTYNTYQEAKIANPESDIYVTRISNGGRDDVFGLHDDIEELTSNYQEANPADHCMTVEKFLADGYKFVKGDAVLDVGDVCLIESGFDLGAYNDPYDGDSKIFILRAAALENIPTETPEEKEVLDGIESAGEVEWDGEGLPPVGAIYTLDPNYDIELLCKYSSEYVVVGEMLPEETYRGMEVIVDTMTQRDRTFRKPETPQQREDRERLEAAYDLYCLMCGIEGYAKFDLTDFSKTKKDSEVWLAIVDKTNYRKDKTHGAN